MTILVKSCSMFFLWWMPPSENSNTDKYKRIEAVVHSDKKIWKYVVLLFISGVIIKMSLS